MDVSEIWHELDTTGSGEGSLEDCQHSNKRLFYVKDGIFHYKQYNCQLPKKDPAPWNC
jgi:hypothetical protein